MKITKRQLRRIIKEACATMVQHHSDMNSDSEEVGMSINQLQAISVIALELSEMIRKMDYVPEWGDGKIATVLDKLNSIRAYMLGKSMGRMHESMHHGSRPGRVSRYKMQMPNSYIKKDIILILGEKGSQSPDDLFGSFNDASSREEFDVAVNDLIKSGTILFDGFGKLKLSR